MMAPKLNKTYSRRRSKINWFNNTNDDSDPFDKLLSSPLKQNVDFKPLSYWENKSAKINSKFFSANKSNPCKLELSDDSSSDSLDKRLKSRWKSLNGRKKKSNLRTKFFQRANSSVNSTFKLEKNVNRLCRKCRKECSCDSKVLNSSSIGETSFPFVTIRRSFNKHFLKKNLISDSSNAPHAAEPNVCNERREHNSNELNKSKCNKIKKSEYSFNNNQSILNCIAKENRFLNLLYNSPCNNNECQRSYSSVPHFQEYDREQEKGWKSLKCSIPDCSGDENHNTTVLQGRAFQNFDLEYSKLQDTDTSDETGSDENNFEISSSLNHDTQDGTQSDTIIPSAHMSSLVDMVSDMTISNNTLKNISGDNNTTMRQISDDSFVDSEIDTTLEAPAAYSDKENIEPSKVLFQNVTRRKNVSQNRVLLSTENNKTYLESRSSLHNEKHNKLSNRSKTMVWNSSKEKGDYHYETMKNEEEPLDPNCTSFLAAPIFESTRIQEIKENVDKSETTMIEQSTCLNKTVTLKPGKQWVRSISVLKRLQNSLNISNPLKPKMVKGRHYRTFVAEIVEMQEEDVNVSSSFSDSLDTSFKKKTLMNHTVKILENEEDSIAGKKSSFRSAFEFQNNVSVIQGALQKRSPEKKKSISARDIVLNHCGQEAVLPFEEYFNQKTLKNCKKIGEGVFGEVFMCDSKTVLKIIPIEGDQEVNGEPQKLFEEILSEIVIASKLSNLREGSQNRTPGFCKMKRCWCVKGKYPKYLLDLWNKYDSTGKGSENDSPEMFDENQLYIILELENGGKDLEAFVFNSAEQSFSILVQAAFSLAAAEKAFEFEHRDLHWGNLLISRTKSKFVRVTLDDVKYNIPTKGVQVSIIDFTLSRILHEDCCLFNDLSLDPTLFTSEGCYQFEIYRMMQKELGNDWSLFRPKTNIFWLHYTIDKMLKMVRYENKNTQVHKKFLGELKKLESVILDYENTSDFVINMELA